MTADPAARRVDDDPDNPYSGIPDDGSGIPELVVPASVTGPGEADRFKKGTKPSAWFTLYYTGGKDTGQWRMIGEILIAHETSELLDRVFDRYPAVKQASKVTFINADQGEVYRTSWERAE